ncbi:LacI family DNA-binding transcriptional regulator [Planctomonas sp. JC2975]|uniref:LacI family DNA-binding transcriptional regulator n=1 Tax=Planctomonas sp. JC2975 TaxID=2729626 RepID=UPI00147524C9|nr:LacI family DNA-binding transcriptional regulator [Planctomonas sp. JC2975]
MSAGQASEAVVIPRGAKRTTISDVAREAGVSKGTVSRVLNGKNWVADPTREAVLAAMDRTGFVANSSARSLALRRTGSLALVLGAPATELFTDPNYALFLQVITDELASFDYSLVFMTGATSAARTRLIRFLEGGHVDGMIYLSTTEPRADEFIQLLESHPIPVIMAGHPFPDSDPLPFVAADEDEGGKVLGAHFLERGYRRVGVITTHLETLGSKLRLRAFTDIVGDVVSKDLIVEASDYTVKAGAAAMRTLMDRTDRPDAVYAVSDVLAAGAIEVAEELGLRVPDDVAVAGFDDSTTGRTVVPPLTTVRQDISAIARELVTQVLGAVDGRPIQSQRMPVTLVVRESA